MAFNLHEKLHLVIKRKFVILVLSKRLQSENLFFEEKCKRFQKELNHIKEDAI